LQVQASNANVPVVVYVEVPLRYLRDLNYIARPLEGPPTSAISFELTKESRMAARK
jgi:hypothetical protein